MQKQTVNDRVKAVRLALNLSQDEFARESKISTSLLSKLETSDKPVSDSVIAKIINRWAVNPDYMEKGGEKIFTGLAPLKKSETTNPWESETYKNLKEEVSFYRDLLKQMTGGKSFLRPIRNAALSPTGT